MYMCCTCTFVVHVHNTKLPLAPFSSPQETETHWLSCEGQTLALTAEALKMSIKGITRSCLGDIFEDEKEVNSLSKNYRVCWREMEVSETETAGWT